MSEIKDCVGKKVKQVTGCERGSVAMGIEFEDSSYVNFYHDQDCCEFVRIEQVDGDVGDFADQVLTMADEEVNERDNDKGQTWTFYKFATVNGYLTVRWCGESSGYYSESVDIEHGAKNG